MDQQGNSLDAFIASNFPEKLPQRNVSHIENIRTIYHYTSVEVFEKMLHDESDFYLSESTLLNDRKELLAGIDLLFTYQKEIGIDLFCGLKKEFVKEYVGNPTEEPWVMCFSSDADSLGQWISYTDRQRGGVAVGFDIDQLFNRIKIGYNNWNVVDDKYGCLMYLVPCFYEESDITEISKLIEYLFGEYREHQLELNGYSDDSARRAITMELILIFSSMIKHESFHAENEWRIVFLPHSEKRVALYKFLGNKPRLPGKMFNKECKLRDAIVDIMISPHGTGINIVRSLLNLCGREDIKPQPSKSPYNGI